MCLLICGNTNPLVMDKVTELAASGTFYTLR